MPSRRSGVAPLGSDSVGVKSWAIAQASASGAISSIPTSIRLMRKHMRWAAIPGLRSLSSRAMTASPRPSESEAFRFWLKLGCISFGGPAGQIAIMHDELVERRRWISERRFLHALNFCMALPGPEAQQLASYVGYSLYGVRGAITAGGLFVAPAFVLLCAMSAVYVEYGEVASVAGVVRGLGAAVIALVAAAVLRVGSRVIHTTAALAMAALAFVLIVAGLPFPVILGLAALAGYVAGRRNPTLLGRPAGHGDADDDAETAVPQTGLRRRVVKALVIWLVPVGLLLLAGGFVAQLTGFFTLAALITFGGAYAVLPFVASAAVNHYGWLTPQDMVAGLALGESTPGPMIMVNTFVVFVARHAAFPGGDPDWLVIPLAAAAFIGVWRFRVGVVTTVVACALVGLAASLVG